MTQREQAKTSQAAARGSGVAVNAAAREQVSAVVQALSRARWRQILVECTSATVFGAVLASIGAVAAIRFGWLSLAPWTAVLGLVALALIAACAFAFARRPDDLQVAIDADLKLNLKQRLSTAWEFMSNEDKRHPNQPFAADDVVGRLAVQAARARLPARSRAGQVFVSRTNAYAMMTPVAVIALILVSVVDLNFANHTAGPDTDEKVISEGVRLRDYGRRMQARARQRDLPRSDEKSLRVQELGSRMQSGSLSRDAALSRLRALDEDLDRERRDALNQGDQIGIAPVITQTSNTRTQTHSTNVQELLQQMLDGRVNPSDAAAQMLGSNPSALARRGISSEEMRDALKRFEAGDRKALEDMLDKMSRADQAARDANELNRAQEQVARARESLGDQNARGSNGPIPSASATKSATQGTPSDTERGATATIEDDGGEDGSSMPGARGRESQRKREQRASNNESPVNESGPQLKAQAQIRDGDVFVSDARVVPRAGKATTTNTQVDARYSQQLEQVLSNEQYPLHYKEFIRRYFLSISEGGRAPQAGSLAQQPPAQVTGQSPQ